MSGMAGDANPRGRAKAETGREWQAFPDLPGTHLSWREIGWEKQELVADGGQVWATMMRRIFKWSWIGAESRRSVGDSPRAARTRRW
jgi:hypothetical protein